MGLKVIIREKSSKVIRRKIEIMAKIVVRISKFESFLERASEMESNCDDFEYIFVLEKLKC